MILQNPKRSQIFHEASHIFASLLDWATPGTLGFSFVSLIQSQVGACVFVSSVCQ